jgi:hypothetical protein
MEPEGADKEQVLVLGMEPVENIRPLEQVVGMGTVLEDTVVGVGTGTIDRMEMGADQTQVILHTTVYASLHYVDILLGEVGEILVFITHRGHIDQFMA